MPLTLQVLRPSRANSHCCGLVPLFRRNHHVEETRPATAEGERCTLTSFPPELPHLLRRYKHIHSPLQPSSTLHYQDVLEPRHRPYALHQRCSSDHFHFCRNERSKQAKLTRCPYRSQGTRVNRQPTPLALAARLQPGRRSRHAFLGSSSRTTCSVTFPVAQRDSSAHLLARHRQRRQAPQLRPAPALGGRLDEPEQEEQAVPRRPNTNRDPAATCEFTKHYGWRGEARSAGKSAVACAVATPNRSAGRCWPQSNLWTTQSVVRRK